MGARKNRSVPTTARQATARVARSEAARRTHVAGREDLRRRAPFDVPPHRAPRMARKAGEK